MKRRHNGMDGIAAWGHGWRHAVMPSCHHAVRSIIVLTLTVLCTAQFGRQREVLCGEDTPENHRYDGRFTFARLRFEPSEAASWGRRGDLKWDHDCPRGERHFTKILDEVTLVGPYLEGGNIFDLDDPELFRHPIAYMCEPGFWSQTDKQAASFRAYLLKGGFAIFDDFREYDWANFEEQIRRVLPEGRLVRLEAGNAVFDSFFRLKTIYFQQMYDSSPPIYYGVYEDNDPNKWLLLIANYNNDISEYWEFSDEGDVPIELSNEAYKLGVDYVIYGMTH